MQESVKREINIWTPNKKYSGTIDMKNDDVRTIDHFNGTTLYWKNPGEKSFDDSIMLSDVEVSLVGAGKLASFNKLQIRITDIILLSDKIKTIGDKAEQMRAKTLSEKAKEDLSKVRILTEMRGDSFFLIVATFHGLFKNKTKQRYIPLTEAKIYEIMRTGAKWEKVEVDLGNDFVALASDHIESCSISDYN